MHEHIFHAFGAFIGGERERREMLTLLLAGKVKITIAVLPNEKRHPITVYLNGALPFIGRTIIEMQSSARVHARRNLYVPTKVI